jgi:hypothetical protein
MLRDAGSCGQSALTRIVFGSVEIKSEPGSWRDPMTDDEYGLGSSSCAI